MEQETKSLINIGINNNNEICIENDFECLLEDKGMLCLLLSILDRLKFKIHIAIDEIEYMENNPDEDDEEGEEDKQENVF